MNTFWKNLRKINYQYNIIFIIDFSKNKLSNKKYKVNLYINQSQSKILYLKIW